MLHYSSTFITKMHKNIVSQNLLSILLIIWCYTKVIAFYIILISKEKWYYHIGDINDRENTKKTNWY